MFIFYTLAYLVILYLGPTMQTISSVGMVVFSLLREFYLVFVLLYFLYSTGFRKKVFFTAENILFTCCCILAIPFVLPAGLGQGVITYIVFFSGPFLFLTISNLKFSDATIKNYHYFLGLGFNCLCIGSILLYFVQGKIVSIFGYENFDHFFLTDGSGKLRLFGLGFHPTTTGFFCIYAMGFLFFYRKEHIRPLLYFYANWLSHTRSALFGIPSYVFFKFKKRIRVFIVIPAILFVLLIYKMFIDKSIYRYIDTSAVVHLMHLFVTGPLYVFNYPFGAGLGRVSPYSREGYIVHLESDLYLYSIQVGILNLLLYIIAVCVVIKKLRNDNSSDAKFLLFVVLTFMLGCIIFPLHSLRFTSNFVFIEMGFYFSQRNYSMTEKVNARKI